MDLQNFSTKQLAKEIVKRVTKDFDTGDVVATPRGEKAVLFAEKGATFSFPVENDEVRKIEVPDDEKVYVVGFGGASAVYKEQDLEMSNFNDGPEDSGQGQALARISELTVEEAADLPEGWTKQSLLEWWAGVGGSFSEAVSALEDTDEFETENARKQAANWKDAALGTERWRSRF